jgi:hypothetical protein
MEEFGVFPLVAKLVVVHVSGWEEWEDSGSDFVLWSDQGCLHAFQ